MSVYENYVLPHLINLACGFGTVSERRAQVVPFARGRVLEVGIGSGLNIPFYDSSKVDLVWGLEPSEGMRKKALRNVEKAPFELRWLDAAAEEIPLEDDSVDTVLLTYTLCTIPGWLPALQQMRRVLKSGGRLLFCEHGEAPDESVRRWQERINPIWNKLAGGCNLNRPIPALIQEAGFKIESIEADYLSRPRFASYNYLGSAAVG